MGRRALGYKVGGGIFAAAAVLGQAGVAGADNVGSTPPGGDPQNAVSFGGGSSWAVHSYSFHNVTSALQIATTDAMNNVYSSTDLVVQRNADNSSADVQVYDDFYGFNGAVAWVNCPPTATSSGVDPFRRCFNQTLKYNMTYATSYGTTNQRKFVACHEIGHTVGLRHATSTNHPSRGDTCLQTPMPNPINASDLVIHGHDVDHINAFH